MAHCITRAPRSTGEAPRPPVKADGSQYEWGILLPGFTRIGWADTREELVAMLVGDADYTSRSPKDQAYARILRGIRLQVATQARLNSHAQVSLSDWERACDWEREILNGPRHVQPSGFPSAELFYGRDVWTCPIPLVLIATAYHPYSDIAPVEGTAENVWWIDPSTDEAFLDSLLMLPFGLIRLWHLEAPSPT